MLWSIAAQAQIGCLQMESENLLYRNSFFADLGTNKRLTIQAQLTTTKMYYALKSVLIFKNK